MAALLAESFEILQREQPEAYARMCVALAGWGVALDVDGECFAVGFSSGHARVLTVTGHEAARVATRLPTILGVLDDRCSLTQAVLEDAVEVVGPLGTLLRLHEGLLFYVRGAVRCPGFAPLLRRLRRVRASTA